MSIPRTVRPARLWRSLNECTSCRRTTQAPREQRRSIHNVPTLIHDDLFRAQGIPGLLSPEGFHIAWTQYQELLLNKLNRVTAGFPEHNQKPKDILLKHARDPATASIFNNASMAHNNQFFFDGLTAASKPLTDFKKLHDSLIAEYGSIDNLRDTMLFTAQSMFGPGFVWLVYASGVNSGRRDGWRILTTYLAGTPYPEAGWRTQSEDQNTAERVDRRPQNSVGAFGQYSPSAKAEQARAPGSPSRVDPVLCVNTWEHVYLRDFGIAGKEEYLNSWWDYIDWHQANNNFTAVVGGDRRVSDNRFPRPR